MAQHHQEPNYMVVFFALAILTAVEIGVVFMPIMKIIVGVMLVLLALVKAGLVAMYFMHLKFEKRTLGVIALTPLMLCTLLIVALLPDLTGTEHRTKKPDKVRVESVSEAGANSEATGK